MSLTSSLLRIALALTALSGTLAACSSVPDLTFPEVIDGGPLSGAVCPRSTPENAVLCCEDVPCGGDCNANYCALCETQCEGALCCMKNNKVKCAAIGDTCS